MAMNALRIVVTFSSFFKHEICCQIASDLLCMFKVVHVSILRTRRATKRKNHKVQILIFASLLMRNNVLNLSTPQYKYHANFHSLIAWCFWSHVNKPTCILYLTFASFLDVSLREAVKYYFADIFRWGPLPPSLRKFSSDLIFDIFYPERLSPHRFFSTQI